MNEIVSIHAYSPKSVRLQIENRIVAAKAKPGQFVIIKFHEDGLRIPFAIVDCHPETGILEVIIHRADGLDDILGIIAEGNVLPDLLGPLGQPAHLESDKTLLFCGDGAGLVPLIPLIKSSKKKGCKVITVISEQSSLTKCLVTDIIEDCVLVEIAADADIESLVENRLQQYEVDKMVFSGPTMMMRDLARLAKSRDIPADCVLNMLMIDGIGLCGVCRVVVGGRQLNTCIDGPVFNAWEVDFDQIINRQRSFV